MMHGSKPHNTTAKAATATPAWGFLWFVVAFIVYGSLLPFDFQETPRPLAQMFAESNFPGNLADALDNFMLFVPLGIAIVLCFRGVGQRAVASSVAILALGLGLQWVQLYLPSRTASLTDAMWNSIGLLVGLTVAVPAHQLWSRKIGAGGTEIDRFAVLLTLVWLFYESFPFVPTLDIGLLRDHIKSAIVAPPFESMRFAQHTLAAMQGGFALLRSRYFQHGGTALLAFGGLAVVLEILVPYGGLRRETLLGMMVGLFVGYFLEKRPLRQSMTAIGIAAVCTYLITVLIPYRDQASDGGFSLTPFSGVLKYGLTKDLPPLAFITLSIGAVFWVGLQSSIQLRSRPYRWLGLVCVCLFALEAVRVLVLGIHGDINPLFIALLICPVAIFHLHKTPFTQVKVPAVQPSQESVPPAHQTIKTQTMIHALSVVALALALYSISRLPGIPYNVRELFPSGISGAMSAVSLALVIYLLANSPLLLLGHQNAKRLLVIFPLLLMAQGIVIWFLLRVFVPIESIYDIVGSPTLGWPWDWELMIRFIALHQSIANQLLGAVLIAATVTRPKLLPGLLYWFVVSLILSWPLHVTVVEWAATDNLTELMRGGGSFYASSLLATAILLSFTTATAFGAMLSTYPNRKPLALLVLVSAGVAAYLFSAGLEPMLVKYDKVFSALQFLLSPDREHYLASAPLYIRFCVAYVSIATCIALLQWSSWHAYRHQSYRPNIS